jgi:hypothetical protein
MTAGLSPHGAPDLEDAALLKRQKVDDSAVVDVLAPDYDDDDGDGDEPAEGEEEEQQDAASDDGEESGAEDQEGGEEESEDDGVGYEEHVAAGGESRVYHVDWAVQSDL